MKQVYLFLFLFVFAHALFAQMNVLEASFSDELNGLSGASTAFDIQEVADGYVAVGTTDFPTGAIRTNIRLIKVDRELNVVFDTTYHKGEIQQRIGRAVQPLNDGGFVIVGRSYNNPFVMRVGENLDTLWTKDELTPGGRWDACTLTPDNHLLLAGWTEIGPAYAGTVQKMDFDGNVIWSKIYDFSQLTDIELLDDGTFLTAGAAGFRGLVMKHQANGDTIWTQNISFSKSEVVYDIDATADGELVFAATGSGFAGPIAFTGKLSASGELQWFASTGFLSAQSVAVESLGFDQLAICGSLTDLYGFSDDGYLALFEEDVSTEPDFSDNFPEGSSAAAMLRDVDGCLVMAGRSSEGFYFRKNCMDVVNTETARIPASGAFVFPQPGDDHVAVGALELERLPADFRLFNTKGQLVRQGQLIQTEQIISTIDLPTGHYVLQLLYKDEVVQRLPVLITH